MKHFPQAGKCLKLYLFTKKNELIYPENYRPVSLLPVLSKILERAVYEQVVSYFESNDLVTLTNSKFQDENLNDSLQTYANKSSC